MFIGVAEAFEIGVLGSAFMFGARHGIDWDHIAAISDITGSQEDRRSSLLFGTIYALGHALVVFVIGSVAILLGANLPEGIDSAMEGVVGVTLIVLGIFVFVSLIKHGRDFRMRSRWMLIFSGVRRAYRKVRRAGKGDDQVTVIRGGAHDHETSPVHVHAGESAVAVAEDVRVSDWHHGHHGRPGHHHHKHPEPPDAFMNYGRGTALVVGMIHGVGAETPTQVLIFLTAAGAGGKLLGEVVLISFLVGLLAANTLITLGSALGFLSAAKNWVLYVAVAVVTGVFSLVLGFLFLFGKGNVLPAFFGV